GAEGVRRHRPSVDAGRHRIALFAVGDPQVDVAVDPLLCELDQPGDLDRELAARVLLPVLDRLEEFVVGHAMRQARASVVVSYSSTSRWLSPAVVSVP